MSERKPYSSPRVTGAFAVCLEILPQSGDPWPELDLGELAAKRREVLIVTGFALLQHRGPLERR